MFLIKTLADKLIVSHFPWNKMNENYIFFPFFSQKTTNLMTLIIFWSFFWFFLESEHTLKPVLSPSTFVSLRSLFRCSRCTRTNSPKTAKCWHRKQRGRNTPAIGSGGSAESVRSHNVPLYYRGNYISIRIIKNAASRCAATCTLSSVSLSLHDTSLPLLLVSENDWRPNSGQNR